MLRLLLCCPERVPQRFVKPLPIVVVVWPTVIASPAQVPAVGPSNTVAASKSNLCDKKKYLDSVIQIFSAEV